LVETTDEINKLSQLLTGNCGHLVIFAENSPRRLPRSLRRRLTARVARTDAWPRLVDLNNREVETLTWAACGKTSAEIA